MLPSHAPRIVVLSHRCDGKQGDLLKVCLDSITKYTDEHHELWVVGNGTPGGTLEWLFEYPALNVILTRGESGEKWTLEEGMNLEIASRVIDHESDFLVAITREALVCRKGWLSYLMSKLSEKIRAVEIVSGGPGMPAGAAYSVCAVYDFQAIKKNNLTFHEHLWTKDEKTTRKAIPAGAGYEILCLSDSIRMPEISGNIPRDSPYKLIPAGRVVDDSKEVILLHRRKADFDTTTGRTEDYSFTHDDWMKLAESLVLAESYNPARSSFESVSPLFGRIDYSLRRYFVDEFFFRYVNQLPRSISLLDIGGKRERKRGQFDVGKYVDNVKYANIDSQTDPDFLCDVSNIPSGSGTFDAVICSEVLEHVIEPGAVLAEAYRLLKPGGIIMVCVPFLFKVHPDPHDFGRYTDQYFTRALEKIGYHEICIEKQGLFLSVVADILRDFAYELWKKGKPKSNAGRRILERLISFGKRKAIELEIKDRFKFNTFHNSYTTGYGIIARKPFDP